MERGTCVFTLKVVGDLLDLVCTKLLQICHRRTLRKLAHAARYVASSSYRESCQNLAIRSARPPFGRKLVRLLLRRCALVWRQVRIIGSFLRGIRFLRTVADKRTRLIDELARVAISPSTHAADAEGLIDSVKPTDKVSREAQRETSGIPQRDVYEDLRTIQVEVRRKRITR
ncbi:hypothetical protein [Paraburkholderia agricolaris]